MGLLDDAIREHLELKRRHGADPDEVTRQEREALGATVRGEFAKPADAEAEADAPPEPPEPDEAAAPDEPEDVAADPEPPAPEPEPEPEPELEPEPEPEVVAEPGTAEDPWLVEDLADEPPGPPATEEAPPAEGEDVLEETPEFLQETPEHDRLWFEQKPPRDFDWDK